jgi:hypothetical protein
MQNETKGEADQAHESPGAHGIKLTDYKSATTIQQLRCFQFSSVSKRRYHIFGSFEMASQQLVSYGSTKHSDDNPLANWLLQLCCLALHSQACAR